MFSKDNEAYGYYLNLPLLSYGEALNNILRKVGFIDVVAMPQLGVATIYVAQKIN
jgi:demethylmenaquinone methyltransferase/2-methoxy-6-polyprenyl-1,4-benzoquinol methylase